MDVFGVCPQLILQNKSRAEYRGFLSVNSKEYYVSIHKPGELKEATIECEWSLKQLLHGYETLLKQRLQQSEDLPSFLQELKSIAEKAAQNTHGNELLKTQPQFYDNILQDIESLGWDRIISIDTSFQHLSMVATDQAGREHVLKITLHKNHPSEAPRCLADLPAVFDPHWTSKHCGLCALYTQLTNQISAFQDFWDMMDEIDCKTWVLEPEKPTRAATRRRIALSNSSSIQIEVHPTNPRMIPECRFLGADNVITPLQESMNKNIHKWNSETSLLSNLENILEVTFPSPANTKKEDFSMECGICYAYRLEDEVPENMCEDRRCGQPFHQTCLYQWLRALPTSRQSFNTVFGECPYCEKPITVKMPTGKLAE